MELRLPSRKRLSGEERRRQILDAALTLILEEGVAALRTEKIARRVGLSPGGIFRHYPSKKAILAALARDLAERLEATLPDEELSPLDWLSRFVEARVRLFRTDPGVRLLFTPEFEKVLPRAARAELRRSLMRTWEALVKALARAQAEGAIRADVPAKELAAAIAALIQAQHTPALAHLEVEDDGGWVWRTVQHLVAARAPTTS